MIRKKKIKMARVGDWPARSFSAASICCLTASLFTIEQGNLVTDARYASYKDWDGTSFPSRIEISRPQEEYDITLNLLKLEINKPLRDDQFALAATARRRGCASG